MSEKTEFTRQFLAWKEALKFTDDSPEAFEEVQRLAQVDRRVQYAQSDDTEPDYVWGILLGEHDDDVDEWFYSPGNDPVIVVTEEDIEDVPLD